MQMYQEALSKLFKAFVTNANVRNDVLQWIGDCLCQNQGREEMLSIVTRFVWDF